MKMLKFKNMFFLKSTKNVSEKLEDRGFIYTFMKIVLA